MAAITCRPYTIKKSIIYASTQSSTDRAGIENNMNTFYYYLLMNGYIIVLPEGTLTSEHRAKAITRELYNITAPLVTQEPYQKDGTVFGVIEHPDGIQFALQVDTEYNIPVSPLATLEKLITLMLELSEVEIRQLSSYVLNAQSFPFGAIIPSTTTVRTQEYMEENGWFPDQPEID